MEDAQKLNSTAQGRELKIHIVQTDRLEPIHVGHELCLEDSVVLGRVTQRRPTAICPLRLCLSSCSEFKCPSQRIAFPSDTAQFSPWTLVDASMPPILRHKASNVLDFINCSRHCSASHCSASRCSHLDLKTSFGLRLYR